MRVRMVEVTITSFPMNTLRTILVATFALTVSIVSAVAGDPNGVWKYSAETPKGQPVESTLTLKWDNAQLSGSVVNLVGKAEIQDAKFVDDQISFTVVRKLRRHKFTTQYTGKLEGDTIAGTIEITGRKDQPISQSWLAKRAK